MRYCLLLFLILDVCLRQACAQTPTSQGVGGYDFFSSQDQMFAFDWDSSGKPDHLVLHRPGAGFVWIFQNSGDALTPVHISSVIPASRLADN